MKPYGYDSIASDLMRLADARELAHAYVFFGEPQTGKFLHAVACAHYIERGIFDEPVHPLQETLIIDRTVSLSGDDEMSAESIGIHVVRNITHFLSQKPIRAPYRTVIVRDAEWLTDQAQNALLKTLEEPPEGSLIILIARDMGVFLPAVASRLQRIYFQTLGEHEMLDFCDRYDIIKEQPVIYNSFGRIGRLWRLTHPEKQDEAIQRLIQPLFISRVTDAVRDKVVDGIVTFIQKKPEYLELIMETLLNMLYEKKQYRAAREVIRFIRVSQTLTLSKRIHLKKIVCLIT